MNIAPSDHQREPRGQRPLASTSASHVAHVGLILQALATQLGWPYATLANYETGRRPIKLAQLDAIATALHRSPAAFLVDSAAAAAIVEQIASNQERCLQVLFFLDALNEQPDAADPANEA